MNTKPEEETQHSTHQHQPPPSSTSTTTTNPPAPPPQPESDPPPSSPSSTSTNPPAPAPQPDSDPNNTNNDSEKWGTHVMGPPAAPSSHPNNQKAAALWSGGEGEEEHHQPQHPYVQYSPVAAHKSTGHNPMEPVINVFNSWSSKTETLARNIWQNLKTGPSVSEAVYGKVGLSTKVITGGGFESLYKQTFTTAPNDKLKKTFACYLSTSTGPVAGTLYLSNINVAFCSDRPLSFTAPSGQLGWSYYKIMIPLSKISSINPITTTDNPSEKYIKIDTLDSHDVWFMGFVNYDKASRHLSNSFSEFIPAAEAEAEASPPPPADGSSVVG